MIYMYKGLSIDPFLHFLYLLYRLQVQKMLHDAAECDARRKGNGFINKLLHMNVL